MSASHRRQMARRKEVIDAKIARATRKCGVLILLKGPGKGKSSSAFGMVARALGHGQRCAVVQFSKGRMDTGEQLFFAGQDNLSWRVMGHGFTWETQDEGRDRRAAQAAWEQAVGHLADPQCRLVVLDELSYMFKYGYLDLQPVLDALRARPPLQNVVITGRTMALPLQKIADTISIIANERHAFAAGVAAQPGIEY